MTDQREVTEPIDADQPCLITTGEVERVDDTTIPLFDDGREVEE